jgi:hypothetical protein
MLWIWIGNKFKTSETKCYEYELEIRSTSATKCYEYELEISLRHVEQNETK